jgi:hypothetical protein
VRRDLDAVDLVEDRPDRADVVLQGAKERGRTTEDADTLRRTRCEQARHGGREDERSAVNALMLDHDLGPGAEATAGSESCGHATNKHVNLGCLDEYLRLEYPRTY